MDLKYFAKAIKDYQDIIEKETASFEKRILEVQNNFLAILNNHINAKMPQNSSTVSKTAGEEIYEDVVKLSRKDYEELQEQLKLIAEVHPELSNKT